MASVILRPNGGAVGHTVTGVTMPTIVGTGAQLGDQSDTTYITDTWNQALGQSNWVEATCEPLTINPAWVTSVDAHIRLSAATAAHPALSWLNSTVSFTHPILFVGVDLAISGGEGIVERSATIADVALGTYYSTWSMLQAATYLTGADVYLDVHATTGAGVNVDLTVYDVWLEVFYTPTGVNPLRRYPPANNGGSGPTRHYPRTLNRRAGGTY